MTNIERVRKITAITQNGELMKLVRGGLTESQSYPISERPLGLKSELIVNRIRELTLPVNLVDFEKFKKQKFSADNPVIEDKKPIDIIEYQKENAYHPSKKEQDTLAIVTRALRRARRASRCKTSGEHSREKCPSGASRCRRVDTSISADQSNSNKPTGSEKAPINIKLVRTSRSQRQVKIAS